MLDQLTHSPHFYHYLYLAVAFLAAFNILEVLFLLVHKTRMERNEIRKEALKHRVSTAIVTVTDPAEILPEPSDYVEYAAYSEAISSVLESFEGEIAQRASGLVRKLGIDSYYRSMARDAVWYKRASPIDTLSAFRLPHNREFFLAVFRSESSADVRYRIVFGLSLLARGSEDIVAISKALSSLPYLTAKYTEDIFFNIITALKLAGKEEDFGKFLTAIMNDASIRPLIKRDCIAACHAAACERAATVVKRYFLTFKHEPEFLIACVRSLVRMGNFDVIHEALFHPDWRVRLTGLKYAHLSKDDLLKDLKRLLHDSNYHIRVNAGQALARLGAPGAQALREAAGADDKFAAEAAAYALTLAEAAR